MWILFAIGASALWGVTYVLNEQIYKKISVLSSLSLATFLTGFIMLAVAYATGHLKKDLVTLATDKKILGLSIAQALCLMVAELLIGLSIANKNATLAGLIEISYPIFIAFFAFLFFRENQITIPAMIGAIMIFSGIFVIYRFSS